MDGLGSFDTFVLIWEGICLEYFHLRMALCSFCSDLS